VGLEIEKRLVLAREPENELAENRMLENIGCVARMEYVAIGEHEATAMHSERSAHYAAAAVRRPPPANRRDNGEAAPAIAAPVSEQRDG
jgi:hypothetical protein